MSDFKTGGVPTPDYDSDDINFVSQKSEFTEDVFIYSDVYAESFNNVGDNLPTVNKHPYFLHTMWVNYQKQTEFNPTHFHKGVYSFVIWMQIPTEYNEQKENPIAKNTNSDVISNFTFDYRDMLGEYRYYTYKMSKKMEGMMLFFPSSLTHTVYPFYNCSENRISISGNIGLDTNIIM